MIDTAALIAAACVLLAAHVLRAARWSLLFPGGNIIPRFDYLLWLATGYVVNTLLPFRLGEALRIAMVSRRCNLRISYVAATVALERLTDLALVGGIFTAVLILQLSPDLSWSLPALMLGLTVCGILFGIAVPRSLRLRRVLWSFAGIFNARISLAITDFFWVFSEFVLKGAALRPSYLLSTVAMWGLYFLSYGLFAKAVGIDFSAALIGILGTPLDQNAGSVQAGTLATFYLFTVPPLVAVLLVGLIRERAQVRRAVEAVRQLGQLGDVRGEGANRFRSPDVYNRYLSDLFRGEDPLTTAFWREALGKCTLHRFFAGGSDAITALVEVEDKLSIRKFAMGAPGQKLKGQAEWLRAHQGGALPLVSVFSERASGAVYSYDMPLIVGASDFYDVIHTRDFEQNRALFCRVLDRIDAFHDAHPLPDASDAVIGDYLQAKVAANARSILEFLTGEFGRDRIEINGRPFDLARFERLTDPVWTRAQIRSRRMATIHGDLTIENIIVAPDQPQGFYIIDPNPENIFNTPLIDWAKLMQSLHQGYESLNRGIVCAIEGRAINLHTTRSHAYSRLHEVLLSEFERRHGADRLSELQFHEIANYLRLTTYKIRQNRNRGLGFCACTALILDEYLDRWS